MAQFWEVSCIPGQLPAGCTNQLASCSAKWIYSGHIHNNFHTANPRAGQIFVSLGATEEGVTQGTESERYYKSTVQT